MMPPKKCTAINTLLLAWLLAGFNAYAVEVGSVTRLSGPLLAKKADGTVKILSQKSIVEQGDTLVSEKGTYALIKFIDNSEITLRPDSQLKVENFSYDVAKPENDHAVFSLIKGGLRWITGLLGKRNHERFGLTTPTATIGIRGTTFIAEYIPNGQPAIAAYGPAQNIPGKFALPPGLYVQVIDGMINVSNNGGSQSFAAGQFGYTASVIQLPVIVPSNPGMQFTPPPAFSSKPPPKGSAAGAKSNTVDCEVR
ncbi:MAG TPA: iron dicitrate transport regulator FecR [Oxalobacteraceae bacterium]|nr:iron dicitrate transport regulator FecR [Oxalobacteraceae bacterium]